MYQRPILVDMYAGVSSPYLMRSISKLDPGVPPPPWRFDVSVLWRQWAIRFDETSDTPPPPLDLHLNNISAQFIGQFTETGVELGPSTAGPWMSEALEQLVPAITGLCSDRAMRDWILEHRAEDDTALRLAALLTRHLGLEDELVDILELAERARAESDARAEADGWGDIDVDRRRNYDTLWSHKRFVRFLDEVDP